MHSFGSLLIGGMWSWDIWTPEGDLKAQGQFSNGILTVGLNALLEAYFREGTQPAAFYAGLIDETDYTTLAISDTMAVHAGWTEITDYSSATRPVWSPGAPASGLMTAPSAMEFTMSSSQTAKGLFMCTDSVKGGTDGTLWAHGLFDTEQLLQASETLKCYYEIEALNG